VGLLQRERGGLTALPSPPFVGEGQPFRKASTLQAHRKKGRMLRFSSSVVVVALSSFPLLQLEAAAPRLVLSGGAK